MTSPICVMSDPLDPVKLQRTFSVDTPPVSANASVPVKVALPLILIMKMSLADPLRIIEFDTLPAMSIAFRPPLPTMVVALVIEPKVCVGAPSHGRTEIQGLGPCYPL